MLGQLKEAGFLSTALTSISQGVVKPGDYEKSDSENEGSLRKKIITSLKDCYIILQILSM